MDYGKESLKLHLKLKGKLEIIPKIKVDTEEMLQLVYTPGVAIPCMEIHKNVEKSYELTGRANTIAVITDGTAVLGLGDIGPEAGMPVMEGKCLLFKELGGVNAVPLCLKTKDPEEIIRTVYLLSGSFGGINLEDISAPRCFEVETKLKEICDIPVFHDDQHGTAIITAAACINAIKLAKKKMNTAKVVINGAGSAGISIAKHLMAIGFKNITMVDRGGVICEGMEGLNSAQEQISHLTNLSRVKGILADVIKGADIFIGVSIGNIVSSEMIKSMNKNAIVFPLANPVPEISYEKAKNAGALIVGTGSSEYPNQINNSLVFPGVFRGALDVSAKKINDEMKIAASYAIANYIKENQLTADYIVPDTLNHEVHLAVAKAVSESAINTGVARVKK